MMGRRKNLNDKFGFVDSMKIKDFIDYEQPNEYIVESDRYNSKYSTPVLTAGQSFILGYTNESKGVYEKGPCIIFDDFTSSLHYVDFPFKVKSSAMKILTTKSNADIKYCYYLLLSLSKMPPNHKRQWISTTSEKSYVLPSMDKQISIVKQLDLISDTIANYTNQIENLDNLVKARFIEMFGDPIDNPREYSVHQLSEYIMSLTSGSRGWAQYCVDDGEEWFITIKNVNNCHISIDNMQPVNAPDNAEAKRTKVHEGDLLISITADLGRTGVVTKEIAEYGAYINQHLSCIRLNRDALNPLFVAHYMESPAGKEQFIAKNQSAVKAGLNFNSINSLKIMVPPLAEQNRFIDFIKLVDKSRFDIKKSIIELEREVVYD